MPTVLDATVVNQAYDTSGNGGRKLVRLSNDWLVAGVWDGTNSRVVFYKSEDNGQTWSQLCYLVRTGIGNNFSLSSKETNVYIVYGTNYVPFYIYQHRFDALTVANTNIASGASTLHYLGSTNGNVQGVSTDINGSEIHATWSAKVDGYKNSNNIFYAKGTINGDGSVTWGAVEQRTTFNVSGIDAKDPCIIIKNNNPIILHSWNNSTSSYRIYAKVYGHTSWTDTYGVVVYDGGSYAQSSPSACVAPNGRIWVAWHGADATDTGATNIRVAYSDDGGTTWSAMTKLTSGNTYAQVYASITVNRNNEVFVLWHGFDASNSYNDIRMIKYSSGSWGSISIIANGTTAHKMHASTLIDTTLDFSTPLFIYRDNQGSKVGFYGTWTVTNISATPGYIGQKTSADKSNILSYSITTDGTMSDIIEKINDVTIATRTNPTSGQEFTVSLTQEQWDAIKYGNGHTLTIEMGEDKWTYTFDKRLNANDDILSAVKGVQDLQDHLNAVKAQLAEAIRAKGGTVNDTDAWSAFVNAVNGIPLGKKFAIGTVTSSAGTGSFQYRGHTGKTAKPQVTVTGLTFEPSFILIMRSQVNGYDYVTIYTKGMDTLYNKVVRIFTSDGDDYAGAIYTFKADVFPAYVNNTGFQLPVQQASASYNWIAFE